jgi:pterin-4a-carbinolamine dehydratase
MKTQEKSVTVVTPQRLKPERVQDGLAARRTIEHLKVKERLDGLPGWELSPNHRAIQRVRRFGDPQGTAAYVAFAVQLAAARRQPLAMVVASGQLALTLHARSNHPLSGLLLDLAAELG